MAVKIKDDSFPSAERFRSVTKQSHPDQFHPDGDDEYYGMTLQAMQQHVGGPIQLLNLPRPVVVGGQLIQYMVIHEEGKIEGLPLNTQATSFAHDQNMISGHDCIVGPALLLQAEEIS